MYSLINVSGTKNADKINKSKHLLRIRASVCESFFRIKFCKYFKISSSVNYI